MVKQGSLLVVGAAPLDKGRGRLGMSVGTALRHFVMDNPMYGTVVTAGIEGEEEYFDTEIQRPDNIVWFLEQVQPRNVVCTIGANDPVGLLDVHFPGTLKYHWKVNVEYPLKWLRAYLRYVDNHPERFQDQGHFVAISSNSAHIARTNSLPYCASKAALSMAVRCAARERAAKGALIYCYEPGFLARTPMGVEVAETFAGALHRIPGVEDRDGLSAPSLARMIADNLRTGGLELNGSCLRLDGGEQ